MFLKGGTLMTEERYERNGSRSLLIFLAGGLIGAGLSLLYAPMSGEQTREYLRNQTERAKTKSRHLSESFREKVDHLIVELKETTERIIEEGKELTKEKKAELLAAIEAGKKAIEEEKEKLKRS
jgi:gas vesicle protein